MVTFGVAVSGGLIALSSARTGDAGAEGVGWADGGMLADGMSSAGLQKEC